MIEPRSFSIGDVKGRQVIDANGDNVGTVEDVAIDPASWKVSGLVVSLRRDVAERLAMGGSKGAKGWLGGGPSVEIRTERIRSVGDNIILNIDRDAIAEALRHGAPPDTSVYGGAPEYRSQAEPGTPSGPDVYTPAQPHQREGPPGF
jgi:sporulation protein YlmC with PRC-barrel domain